MKFLNWIIAKWYKLYEEKMLGIFQLFYSLYLCLRANLSLETQLFETNFYDIREYFICIDLNIFST